MTYLSIMKRTLICSLFIFFLLIGASRAAEVEASFFTPHEGPLQLDPLSVNPAIVLRQRLVSIRFELLPMTEGQAVVLNLFEDVVVRAICNSVEANVSDGFVWNGHIQDLLGGLVTLTVADQALAGTVVLPTLIYHIRSFRDQAHVVREIRPPAPRTARFLAEGAPSSVENEVAELVNLEREIENLHPLIWDNALGSAARDHSTDMAQQNYFSHTSLDGRVFNQRITAAGYPYSTCGENIAAGYSSPQAVMNGWMNSSGHRANILNSAFCDLGVGYAFGSASAYGHYWTQDFGRRQGVSVCALAEYTIIATAGLHGRIQPSGSVKVQSGANQTFQITPDKSYSILEVKIDGVLIGKVATYTFDSVTKNHYIDAYFEEAPKGAKPAPWIPFLLLGD
jgi:uncharacterized protein YkwD